MRYGLKFSDSTLYLLHHMKHWKGIPSHTADFPIWIFKLCIACHAVWACAPGSCMVAYSCYNNKIRSMEDGCLSCYHTTYLCFFFRQYTTILKVTKDILLLSMENLEVVKHHLWPWLLKKLMNGLMGRQLLS